MKRIVSFILALLLIFCMAVPALAASGRDGGISWEIDVNTGVFTVSGNGAIKDYDVESNYAPWFFDTMFVNSVVIEPGITRIGDYAFAMCFADNISIPETVKTIGEGGLSCMGFSSLALPEGLEEIEMMGLTINTSLTEISFPSTLRILGDAALLGCTELENIVLNEGLESIGMGAFSLCDKLDSVYIPASVKTAGEDVFVESPVTSILYGGSESQWNALVARCPGLKASGAVVRYNVVPDRKAAIVSYTPSTNTASAPALASTPQTRGGYIPVVYGAWSNEPVKNRLYQTKYAYELDEPLINCTQVTLLYNYSISSGDPFGSWYLYARGLDGEWSSIATFRLDEGSEDRDLEFVFEFDKPVSFDAITIGKVYDSNYSISQGLGLVDAYVNP